MTSSDPILLRHQNMTWAIREGLGWPSFKPVCDSIIFVTGRLLDPGVTADLVRHSQALDRDVIYTGWATAQDQEPGELVVVLRELLTVDVIAACHLWAADEQAPLAIVAPLAGEHFVIGRRGLIERRDGLPPRLKQGRKLAMRRVRAAAAGMGNELCPGNRRVPNGGIAQPAAPADGVVVRFC